MHFLIKGIPVRHLFSIRKFHHQDRQLTREELTAVLETRPEALLNLYVDEKAPFEAFVGVIDIAKLKRGGHFVISTQPSER